MRARRAQAGLLCAAGLGLAALAPTAPELPPCLGSPPAAPAASPRCPSPQPAPEGPARLLFGLPLDPNRAEPGSLEALPGIGPARAAAIVNERCRRPFTSLVELERVRGIGPRTRAGLEPWLAIGDPAQARCAALQ